jgi:FkbM family methyltransferase
MAMMVAIRRAASCIPWLRLSWRRYWYYRYRVEKGIREIRRYRRADEKGRLALKREWLFDLSPELTPILGVVAREGTLLVQTSDLELGRFTFRDGPWEQDLVDLAIRLAEKHSGRSVKGNTVVEIGASIGTTTLVLLQNHGVERVIAFEPVPDTVAVLRGMLALNGLDDRVDVRAVALSDRPGVLQMELSDRSPGDNRVRATSPGEELQGESDREVTEVRGSTLDLEVDDLESVSLVWMDAQGHEGHVLVGAKKLLASDVPIMTEFWPYALRREGGLGGWC